MTTAKHRERAREIVRECADSTKLCSDIIAEAIAAAHAEGREEMREEAAEQCECKTGALLLACGEMSAQELRTTKAVLNNRAAAIRSIPRTLAMADTEKPEPRTTLADGTQIYPEHRNLKPNGQQEGYVVLAEEERAKGFVRPVRRTYIHIKRNCGARTTMSQTIAETYARNPHFYSGTFCCGCSAHWPVGEDGEFVWADDGTKVGT